MNGNLPEILTTSKFYLELTLDGSQEIDAYFMDCQGFQVKQEPIELAEVTPQKWGKASKGLVERTKIPGNVKYSNFTLKRGMSISQTMWKWFESVQQGSWGEQRRDGSLTIYNQAAQEAAKYTFSRAWPSSYKIKDLSASANEFQIEELELVVEEFKRVK